MDTMGYIVIIIPEHEEHYKLLIKKQHGQKCSKVRYYFLVYGYMSEKMWILFSIYDCDGFTFYFWKKFEKYLYVLQWKKEIIWTVKIVKRTRVPETKLRLQIKERS